MNIQHDFKNDTLYVALGGELDESHAAYVRETLDNLFSSAGVKKVVIDMSRLSFMDSTGIGVLIGRYKALKSKGISIMIASPSKAVDKVLSLTGIYKIMPKIIC